MLVKEWWYTCTVLLLCYRRHFLLGHDLAEQLLCFHLVYLYTYRVSASLSASPPSAFEAQSTCFSVRGFFAFTDCAIILLLMPPACMASTSLSGCDGLVVVMVVLLLLGLTVLVVCVVVF